MRLHRFYINPEDIELEHNFWVHDEALRNQWLKVLRYKVGDQVVLFDGVQTDRLYKLVRVELDGIELEMVTEFERKLPHKHVYLFWSLLKKDKNEWVIQKCTELGVTNFVPVIADRSEKTGFNMERTQKIAIEASEQCGRSDIPHVREPQSIEEIIEDYKDKVDILICDEKSETDLKESDKPVGVLIGPEGGWSETELSLFKKENLGSLHLGQMTLRAETAAISAATKLLQ